MTQVVTTYKRVSEYWTAKPDYLDADDTIDALQAKLNRVMAHCHKGRQHG